MPITEQERNSKIVKYSLIGIGANLVLAILKVTVGVAVHSRAVVLDGANGLADMLTAVVTILSTTAAGRRSDKRHPLGYGRLEYVSSLFITAFIMYMGIRAIIDSVKAIIEADSPPSYNMTVVILMIVSVFFKAGYGLLLRREGKKLNSVALIMTGTEAMSDAAISLGILGAIVVLRTTGFNIEPYISILISLLILGTGLNMLWECAHKIIGTRPDPAFEKKIKQTLIMEEGVLNVCNLIVHSYGEHKKVGSVDIEVDENMTAAETTRLSRRLIRRAAEQGMTLTSVGITGSNLSDPRAAQIWDTILDKARSRDGIRQVELFTVDFEEHVISFYVVADYSSKGREDSLQEFREDLERTFPDMKIELQEAIDM